MLSSTVFSLSALPPPEGAFQESGLATAASFLQHAVYGAACADNGTASAGNCTDFLRRNATGAPLPLDWPLSEKQWLLAVGLAAVDSMVVLGNVLVLLAVLLNARLRSATNYFVVSLAAADLLLGLLVLPFSAYLEVVGSWPFGYTFCCVWAAADVLCCTASIFSLCVISVDRYIAITRPLRHPILLSRRRAAAYVALLWTLALAVSAGPLTGWREPPADANLCSVTTQLDYVIFSTIISFYAPSAVIITVYIKIYRAAVSQSSFVKNGYKMVGGSRARSDRRTQPLAGPSRCVGKGGCKRLFAALLPPNSKAPVAVGTEGQDSAPERPGAVDARRRSPPMLLRANTRRNLYSQQSFQSFELSPKRKPTVDGTRSVDSECRSASGSPEVARHKRKRSSLTQRLLGVKLSEFNKEKKAAKTLGIVVGVFLVCWFPFFFVLPLGSICGSCDIPPVAFTVFFWLGYINSMLNPIIYACWSREFKKAFTTILKCQCSRNSNHNKKTIATLIKSSVLLRDSATGIGLPVQKLDPQGKLASPHLSQKHGTVVTLDSVLAEGDNMPEDLWHAV